MTDTTGEPLARTIADTMAERGTAGMGAVLWLGMAAGMQISLGGIAYLIASAGMPSGMGVTHLLAGLAFSSGLMLVMVTGTHLFTGHAMLSLSIVQRRVLGVGAAQAWGVVWVANPGGWPVRLGPVPGATCVQIVRLTDVTTSP